jgi:hypothetical protein
LKSIYFPIDTILTAEDVKFKLVESEEFDDFIFVEEIS